MFVPAERNFISYVRRPQELKLSSDAFKEFLSEFEKAKAELRGRLPLPINGAELEYDKLNDTLSIHDDPYKLRLTDASSGFQSAVPLFVVSRSLAYKVKASAAHASEGASEPMTVEQFDRFKSLIAEIYGNESLTQEQKRSAISTISSRFNKTAFVNIIEEPEQNLFPTSQWAVTTQWICPRTSGHRLTLE